MMTKPNGKNDPAHVSVPLEKLTTQIQNTVPNSDDFALRELRRQRNENWKSVLKSIGKRYADCRIHNFELSSEANQKSRQTAVIDALKEFGESINENVKNGRGVVLFGPPGTGKDHLLTGLMYRAVREGNSVRWINGVDLFAEVRETIDSNWNQTDLLKGFTRSQILVISDPLPPWGALSQFQSTFLFRLLDKRYRNCQPTWVTGNFADGADASDRIGSQVLDRLKHGALVCHCNWESYRKKAG